MQIIANEKSFLEDSYKMKLSNEVISEDCEPNFASGLNSAYDYRVLQRAAILGFLIHPIAQKTAYEN